MSDTKSATRLGTMFACDTLAVVSPAKDGGSESAHFLRTVDAQRRSLLRVCSATRLDFDAADQAFMDTLYNRPL